MKFCRQCNYVSFWYILIPNLSITQLSLNLSSLIKRALKSYFLNYKGAQRLVAIDCLELISYLKKCHHMVKMIDKIFKMIFRFVKDLFTTQLWILRHFQSFVVYTMNSLFFYAIFISNISITMDAARAHFAFIASFKIQNASGQFRDIRTSDTLKVFKSLTNLSKLLLNKWVIKTKQKGFQSVQ